MDPIFDFEPSLDCDAELMTALADLDEQFLNDINLFHDPHVIEFNQQKSTGLLEDMEAFTRIPVSDWQGEHCVDWAVSVCRSRGIQEIAVDVSSLGHITGYQLLRYTVNDFAQILGELYGSVFYKELQKMEKGGIDPHCFEDIMDLSRTGPHAASLNQPDYNYYPESPEQALNLSTNSSSVPSSDYHSDYHYDYNRDTPSTEYNYDYNRDTPSTVGYQSDYLSSTSGYQSDYQMEYNSDGEDYCVLQVMAPVDMTDNSHSLSQGYKVNNVPNRSYQFSPVVIRQEVQHMEEDIIHTGPHEVPTINQDREILKAKTRVSRNEHVPMENSQLVDDFCKKISTTSRARERGPKNWEFLIRLLLDPRANPKLIRWEDEAKGTFRLVRPEIITSMWNAKSTKKLSYDNFARGLRYHYKTGALFKVGDRQLVYGCGPKALELMAQIRREGL